MKGQVAPAMITVFAVIVNVFTFASILTSWGVGKETFTQYASFTPQEMAEDVANLVRISIQSKENLTLTYIFPRAENFTYDLIAENFTVKIFCHGCEQELGVERIPVNITAKIIDFEKLKITKSEEGVLIGAA